MRAPDDFLPARNLNSNDLQPRGMFLQNRRPRFMPPGFVTPSLGQVRGDAKKGGCAERLFSRRSRLFSKQSALSNQHAARAGDYVLAIVTGLSAECRVL